MNTPKTPGVYVEEISTLPPSVAEVSTAIPAFIGYTEIVADTIPGAPPKKAVEAKADTKTYPRVARIETLLEYETLFGKANPKSITVTTKRALAPAASDVRVVDRVEPSDKPDFLMYYCLKHYFANGGGACYIVSVGDYTVTRNKQHFLDGLTRLQQEDEPTLILLTDAANLGDDYYPVCEKALAQCENLGDRFAILDVLNTDDTASIFRNKISSNLKYGAAYLPYLRTTLNYRYKEEDVKITSTGASPSRSATTPTDAKFKDDFGVKGITVTFTGKSNDAPTVEIIKTGTPAITIDGTVLKIETAAGTDGNAVVEEFSGGQRGFNIVANDGGTGSVGVTIGAQGLPMYPPVPGNTLKLIETTETALHNQIKAAIADIRVVLPPSAAMAGIYARVDRERGVWKAPANVSVASVIGPTLKITDKQQEDLNVDPTAGKSINAIRSFTGKGTLVWGGRTLAGNDNEWRYINVRRLFNMIEESTQKATSFAVFEANDATTWLKVKGMIESFLYGLWEQGALAGPKPESAYFVNVGLGKTMTTQDILEGRMNVEIGIAAVRPAEFIILKFSHKMQEA